MAINDLVSQEDVSNWLQGASADPRVPALTTSISRAIYSYLGRPALLPATYEEIFDGRGHSTRILREWPVSAVSAVLINGRSVPASPPMNVVGASRQRGFFLDVTRGDPPGQQQFIRLYQDSFAHGVQNCVVQYTAGYQVTGEEQMIADGTIDLDAPYGEWGSDLGVTYQETGAALVKVASNPDVGQYSVNATGGYAFNASDDEQVILVSYGFIPADIANACLSWISDQISYQGRIGERTKSLGGAESVSYMISNMPPYVTALLGPYQRVTET